MGGAGGMIGEGFRIHPSLILCPWGDERLLSTQSLSLVFIFPAHFCFVLSEHYIIHCYEARLVEAQVKFGFWHSFVIFFFWPRLLPHVVAYNWSTITMVTC